MSKCVSSGQKVDMLVIMSISMSVTAKECRFGRNIKLKS